MTILWSVAFLGCTAAVLVPTPLVEPRYFLIPLIILRLQLEAAPCMPCKATPTSGGGGESDVDTEDATGVHGVESASAVDPRTSSSASPARSRRGAPRKERDDAAATSTTRTARSSARVNVENQSSARQHAEAGNTADANEGAPPERGTPDKILWVEWAWYGAIHCATLGLFLVKKFRWEGWEGWMRFMW